jgi:hypothetical protein
MRKLPLPLIVALGGIPVLAHAAPKPCTDPLRAWEIEARKVDAANKKAKANQQMPLPPLVLDGGHLDCLRTTSSSSTARAWASWPRICRRHRRGRWCAARR